MKTGFNKKTAMKQTITKNFLAVFIFICSASFVSASSLKDSVRQQKCLEVIGIALGEKNEVINGAEITLFKENEEMEWIEITHVTHHDHNFIFTLDSDSYYTIEIAKAGYVKRSIAISTRLPEDVSLKTPFSYGFEVVLFKAKEGVDDFYFDFPVGMIAYDETKRRFENSNSYTRHIKTKIRNSIKGAESGNVSK